MVVRNGMADGDVDVRKGFTYPVRTAYTQKGFALIELLIAMSIGLLLLAAVAGTFINQRKTYDIREQVVGMQQNARGGLDYMIRELAMVGYDPTETAGAAVVAASANTIQVSMDLNQDGDTGDTDENVTYVLYDDKADGDLDIGRDAGGGNQLVASNIQDLVFLYRLADGSTTSNPPDLSQIRAIDISLTARTAQPDPQYPTNGGYRTFTLTATVWARNLGL